MKKVKLEIDLELIKSKELIDKIYEFKAKRCPDYSIWETLLEYAEYNGLSLQVMGNLLSEDKYFVELLEKQLVKEKILLGEVIEGNIDDEEW